MLPNNTNKLKREQHTFLLLSMFLTSWQKAHWVVVDEVMTMAKKKGRKQCSCFPMNTHTHRV